MKGGSAEREAAYAEKTAATRAARKETASWLICVYLVFALAPAAGIFAAQAVHDQRCRDLGLCITGGSRIGRFFWAGAREAGLRDPARRVKQCWVETQRDEFIRVESPNVGAALALCRQSPQTFKKEVGSAEPR